ncbi:MAG: polymerase sigma factor, sigma-70 family [Verrucomicrobiaceae bacterium]|nr:polymerase sigma factor, sigma-70 family [Verrucomicrobiaceae bacterium]
MLAARGDSPDARQALSDLCALNYAPVLRFLRASGLDADDAQELAHGFFAEVLGRHSFDGVDPARGRFRSYLLGALKHFITAQRMRDSRLKRGAGIEPERLDADTVTSHAPVPAALRSEAPDALFDREWALAIIARALAGMEEENASAASRQVFTALKPWLSASAAPPVHAEVAARLGMSEGALRVAIHRLRKRFRELVRAAVLQTLQDETELDSEMQHLIKALAV